MTWLPSAVSGGLIDTLADGGDEQWQSAWHVNLRTAIWIFLAD